MRSCITFLQKAVHTPLLLVVSTVILALAAFSPTAASARRPATTNQAANITHVAFREQIPARCAQTFISTVNETWASVTAEPANPGCSKYVGDGMTVLHFRNAKVGLRGVGFWQSITAGSDFQCPVQSFAGRRSVPQAVVKDLRLPVEGSKACA